MTLEVTGSPIENGLELSVRSHSEATGIQEAAMLFNALMKGAAELFQQITDELTSEQHALFLAATLGFAMQDAEANKLKGMVESLSKN